MDGARNNRLKDFNEQALIAAVCEWEQAGKDIKKVFDPAWLKDAELKPVLKAVFDYYEEQAAKPSLDSLSQYMEMKDEKKFKARWKSTIDQIRPYTSKRDMMIFNLGLAKEAAASFELNYLLNEQRFQQMLSDGNAQGVKSDMSLWLSKHTDSEDEGLYSIQDAFDKLIEDHPWQGKQPKIGTGILPIDTWAGGLRSPQLGIIMAPTGGGKSSILMNIARYAAAIEQKTVLFITNELTVNEQTERFLVRMQKPKTDKAGNTRFVSLNEIQDDPGTAYQQLAGYQKELNKHLYIYSAGLDQNINEIDDVLKRIRNEQGKWPDMLVIDYLERMAPVSKMDKNSSWTYYGQIAKELVWLAKRRNCGVWTAIQTNRSGLNTKTDMSLENAQGSIQHLQEASLVLGVRKVQVPQGSGLQKTGLEFTEMKSRHGIMEGRKMIVEVDLGRMWISNNVIENILDIEDADADIAPKDGKKRAIKGQAQVKGKT